MSVCSSEGSKLQKQVHMFSALPRLRACVCVCVAKMTWVNECLGFHVYRHSTRYRYQSKCVNTEEKRASQIQNSCQKKTSNPKPCRETTGKTALFGKSLCAFQVAQICPSPNIELGPIESDPPCHHLSLLAEKIHPQTCPAKERIHNSNSTPPCPQLHWLNISDTAAWGTLIFKMRSSAGRFK